MGKPATRRPVEETKRVLLQTGLDLLMSDTGSGDFTVKLKDVVDRAERTTGSAYQIWKSQTAYRHDLALFVAESVEYADPVPIGEFLGPQIEQATSMEEIIELVGAAYFDYFFARPEFAVFLRLASLNQTDPEVAEAVLRGYAKLQETLGMFLELAVVSQGTRIYGPETSNAQVASVVTALTEGFAVKARFSHRGDPEQVDKRLAEIRAIYVMSLVALMQALTVPVT